MIKLNTKQLKKLSKNLRIKRISQIRAITRSTINDQAFAVQKTAKKITIPGEFHNRTSWIASSILVDKAKKNVMKAETGAKKRWKRNPSKEFEGMREQEKGDTIRKPIIHTLVARGGAFARRVRPSSRRNKLGRIRNIQRRLQIREHDLAGNKSAMRIRKSTGIRPGIYKFMGGRVGKRKLRMIQDLSQNSTRLPKRPWLKKAVRKAVNNQTTLKWYAKNFKRFTK